MKRSILAEPERTVAPDVAAGEPCLEGARTNGAAVRAERAFNFDRHVEGPERHADDRRRWNREAAVERAMSSRLPLTLKLPNPLILPATIGSNANSSAKSARSTASSNREFETPEELVSVQARPEALPPKSRPSKPSSRQESGAYSNWPLKRPKVPDVPQRNSRKRTSPFAQTFGTAGSTVNSTSAEAKPFKALNASISKSGERPAPVRVPRPSAAPRFGRSNRSRTCASSRRRPTWRRPPNRAPPGRNERSACESRPSRQAVPWLCLAHDQIGSVENQIDPGVFGIETGQN